LPLGIELPTNASFRTEGGLFHVCIGLDNLSVRGTLEKIRERICRGKAKLDALADLLPDGITVIPPLKPTRPPRPDLLSTPRPTIRPTTTRPQFCPDDEDSLLSKMVNIENEVINIDRTCFDWDELMGENFYRSLKICKRIGIGSIVFAFFTIVAYLIKGFTLFTFEMICISTAMALALTLTLIATVPTMLDLYCNCHQMIGNMGWVQVTGNIIQLASAGMFLTQIGSLKLRPQFCTTEKIAEVVVLVTILAMNLYVLSCNTLYDSRPYHDIHGINGTAKLNPRWYGFWEICGTKYVVSHGGLDRVDVCTKWTDSIAGVWTPSPYWADPKPIGTYYLPAIAVLVPATVIACLMARGIMKRFLQVAISLANFILVIGVTCLVDSLPVSDLPLQRNNPLTKSYYGAGWYVLLAAMVLSIVQVSYNTVVIYTLKVEEMLEDIVLPEERFGYLKSPKPQARGNGEAASNV